MENSNSLGPNIILIMADQLRFDALGCYGNTQIHTPYIDSLALNGSIFDNHYTQNPVCGPSRCSILTGRYPRNHGSRDNGIPLRDSEITFPEVMRANGYRTAAIGKMHFTSQIMPKENEEDDWPEDTYGFDEIHTTCDTKTGEYLEWIKKKSNKDFEIVKLQGELKMKEDCASAADKIQSKTPQVYGNDINPEYHQSAWIADRTIDFINENGGKRPFFAWCSFVDPHHPFDPPAPYSTMYDADKMLEPKYQEGELDDKALHFTKHRFGRGYSNEKYDYSKLSKHDWGVIKAAYYGMISLIDDNIGRILKALKEKNIERETLIILTSDHGELLGDHGLLFKGPFQYDCLIKVPMIMKWPDVVPQGSRYEQITEHVDIMATILDYAGIRAPNGMQGISMAPILRGDTGAGRKFALTEFHCYDWGLDIKTITGRQYKLTYYAGEKFGELYDRQRDPKEIVNLWEDDNYNQIKNELIIELLNVLIQTEDTIPIRIGKF